MLSTLLELAGFAAIVAATYLLGGLVPCLYTAGGLLLLVGYAVEDEQAALALRGASAPVRGWLLARRQARVLRSQQRELAKVA